MTITIKEKGQSFGLVYIEVHECEQSRDQDFLQSSAVP